MAESDSISQDEKEVFDHVMAAIAKQLDDVVEEKVEKEEEKRFRQMK